MMDNEADKVIFTRHPEGKKGAVIPKTDYYQISEAILAILQQEERITLPDLIDGVKRDCKMLMMANAAWRILVVKLDLEAKGLIKSVQHKYDKYTVYLKLNRREWKRQNAA